MTKKKIGSRTKLRNYFLENIGKILDSDTLRNIADTSEWARRIRELRNEEGMNIITHNDDSKLKPGQYMLVDKKILPAFERTISKETRAFVLDRNGYTCQMCGAVAGEPHPYNPLKKTRLHIGHIIDKSQGGSDEPSNLRALCSVCNEGASNITLQRPSLQKLFIQIRRSTGVDQLEVMKWLINKFPIQAQDYLKEKENIV